jgi:glycosyltransferase involved in cell wall biosynthesis
MPREPLVTALLPVHDHDPEYLNAAIDSLDRQSESAWRALVIVESDRRAYFQTLLAQALEDPRIEVVTNEGRWLGGAFNTGMRHAHTDFVAILFADDMWEPDAVAVLEREIRARPNVDFFHSSRRVVDDHGHSISSIYRSFDRVDLDSFTEGAPVKHLLCWRREMGIEIGGMDESLRAVGTDDFDFPWTMAEHGAQFGAIEECLYVYRDHRTHRRLTTHEPRRMHARELARVFRKHGMSRADTRLRVRRAKREYLKQCLFRSRFDRFVKETLGISPARGWRTTYR